MSNGGAYLDLTALATLGGAVVGTVVITNAVRLLSGITSLIVPFLASLAIVAFSTAGAAAWSDPSWYMVTLINTCLLFCTAMGANGTIIQLGGKDAAGAQKQGRGQIRFFSSWTTKKEI